MECAEDILCSKDCDQINGLPWGTQVKFLGQGGAPGNLGLSSSGLGPDLCPDGSREQLQFSDLGSGTTSSVSKLEKTKIPLFAKSQSTVLALEMVDVAQL